MTPIPESKKSHLWRKIIWHTDPDLSPLGPFHSAEIYCCEEANGYAVWYVRRLARDDRRGHGVVENGDYLLGYFSRARRDDAIERAVLIANCRESADDIIAEIDRLAGDAQKV
ncbi:hypothetical protein SAMN06265795_102235 [Noviherbaspirillum humi]|uniref:Uncharacterized protein n=1 Tax=Noviherbaspirillum humi TaxID=1688639 RepID=A0A239DK60_9BURK|nr:hypothetical protein [Noviherbaspirillum humi]SNS32840.1 hypothetical protein SAMN06265795_102235 [Noviherbaspirillum humi]